GRLGRIFFEAGEPTETGRSTFAGGPGCKQQAPPAAPAAGEGGRANRATPTAPDRGSPESSHAAAVGHDSNSKDPCAMSRPGRPFITPSPPPPGAVEGHWGDHPETATMAISQARSDSARRNGARSRGPVTPRGKAVARANSLAHGMTGEGVVLRE